MKNDPEYQKVLECLHNDGYAECRDWVVRGWLCYSRIAEHHVQLLAQALSDDLKRTVRVDYPSRNHRDFQVRFFCMGKYISQSACQVLPKRQFVQNFG
jgi:hypothetical protein